MSRTSNSNLHVAGESDGRIVPTKGPNGEGQLSKEGLEGRRPTKENIGQTPMARTQSRFPLYRRWDGVREAARKDKEVRFTQQRLPCLGYGILVVY